MGQFLGPETDIFRKFLVPIKTIGRYIFLAVHLQLPADLNTPSSPFVFSLTCIIFGSSLNKLLLLQILVIVTVQETLQDNFYNNVNARELQRRFCI